MRQRISTGQLSLFNFDPSADRARLNIDSKFVSLRVAMENLDIGKIRVESKSQSATGVVVPFRRDATTSGRKDDEQVLHVMAEHIGHRHALLLHLLGYTRVIDLAKAHPAALLSIAGIGKHRLSKIQEVVTAHGHTPIPHRPERTPFQRVYRQLKSDFDQSS